MNAKLGYRMDEAAAGRLLAGVVEQAIDDLRRLQAAGFIVAGKAINLPSKKNHFREACELLHFFEPGGMAEKTCRLLKMEAGFARVRQALNLETKTSQNEH